MRAHWRRLITTTVSLLVLFVLGCSGNGDPPPPGASTTPSPVQVTGLFTEPRETTPDEFRSLEADPMSQFEPWDGLSTVLYDRVTGEELNLGQGDLGQFSPAGMWMGWTAGPPYDFNQKEAWVIELSTLDRQSLGPGSLIRFISDDEVVVQVATGGQGAFEIVDLLTGERRASDSQQPQERLNLVDGLAFFSTALDQVNGVENADGQVLLKFDAFRATFAGPGEIVVATIPEGSNMNIFAIDIESGAATFIASSPITRIANHPLAANEDFVIWTDDYCRFPDPGRTRVFDRGASTITELDQALWVSLTPDGLIASGTFGAKALLDPETFAYVFVVPDLIADFGGESSGPDVSWSRDYRYVSRGFAGGHGGLCG